MKKLMCILLLLLCQITGMAQNRFPKPDFESGYQYPDIQYAVPNETLWETLDIVLLVALMSLVAWAAIKKQTRKPIFWVTVLSVGYFGFFRSGCICSMGAIQNVAVALVDDTYVLPITVLLLFILPLVFAFFFGRVFCAGVCPMGALQDLVNIKNYRLSKAVTAVLGVIPWLYLIFALLYAVTRSTFIICRFDPFIGIFRLGGDFGMIVFGVLFLLASVFTGRPFCRFLCPYGALLSLVSRVAIWPVKITRKPCITCELCHNACPVDAIKAPYDNKVQESRREGVKRLLNYFVVLPVMIVVCAFLMRLISSELSRAHKEVRLYDMVMQQETHPQDVLSLELEVFYGQGGTVEAITQRYEAIQRSYKRYATMAGALIGLVLGLSLIKLSVKRSRKTYEIDHGACVVCGRCFSYCPQNNVKTTAKES